MLTCYAFREIDFIRKEVISYDADLSVYLRTVWKVAFLNHPIIVPIPLLILKGYFTLFEKRNDIDAKRKKNSFQ